MDSNEYQKTIEELEKSLREKQEELDGISARKAAIQLKGMAGLTEQVDELALLNKQLKNAKDQYEEVEKKVGRIEELEKIMAVQQDEISRLSEENTALKLEIVSVAEEQEVEFQLEDKQKDAWEDEKATWEEQKSALEEQIDELQSKLDAAEQKEQTEKDPDTGVNLEEDTITDSQSAELSPQEEMHEVEREISSAEPVRVAEQNNSTTASPLLPNDILQRWLDK